MTEVDTYEFEGEEYKLTSRQIDILETLKEHGPLTRGYNGAKNTLTAKTGESRTTLYENLEKLKEKGLVFAVEYDNRKQGRPKVFWSANIMAKKKALKQIKQAKNNGGNNQDVQEK
jgi:predicted ArsR family transcriptional regulator